MTVSEWESLEGISINSSASTNNILIKLASNYKASAVERYYKLQWELNNMFIQYAP